MQLRTIENNVIYKRRAAAELKHGSIELAQPLSRDTQWCDVVAVGETSALQPGDEIMLSKRPVSCTFQHDGETLHNTSDGSCLAYKRHGGDISCTEGTILYEVIQPPEEQTASGIVLVRRTINKELEPIRVLVVAAGPKAGVQPGDEMLIAFKADCYKIEYDGRILHNAGKEEIIAYFRK